MQPTARTFRILVVASTVVYFAWLGMPFFPSSDAEARIIDQFGGLGLLFPIGPIGQLVIVALWLASSVGLFFFRQWGRALFSLMTAWSVIDILTAGLSIEPAVQVAIGRVNSLLDGAILVLAYSALSHEFRKGA